MLRKVFINLILFILLAMPALCYSAILDWEKTTDTAKQTEAFAAKSPFDTNVTIAGVVGVVVKAFLGLLATIFLILMLKAGYDWMTAQGEEEKVRQAKHTIQRAVIGLLIISMAYGLTAFVMSSLPSRDSVGAGTSVTGGSGP